jgi:hypothetical protein
MRCAWVVARSITGPGQLVPDIVGRVCLQALAEGAGLERPVVVAFDAPLEHGDEVVEAHVEVEDPLRRQELVP